MQKLIVANGIVVKNGEFIIRLNLTCWPDGLDTIPENEIINYDYPIYVKQLSK